MPPVSPNVKRGNFDCVSPNVSEVIGLSITRSLLMDVQGFGFEFILNYLKIIIG